MRKIKTFGACVVLILCSGCKLASMVTNSEALAGQLTAWQGMVQGALLDYWGAIAPIVDSLP